MTENVVLKGVLDRLGGERGPKASECPSRDHQAARDPKTAEADHLNT